MNKYLLNLFKQFNDMLGIRTLDFNQEFYKTEFINWIKDRYNYSKIYQDYIQYLDINLNDEETAELNKGVYDSIALTHTTIISLYAKTFGYLLKLINENDVSLYNYLVCHINLLDDLKLEIQNIELNWNLYIEELERVKYNVIIDEVHDYFQEHEKEIKYEENEFLYRIAIELGIATQIKNIMDQNYPYDFDEYLENIKVLVDKKDMKFIELRHYENIKKIILKYLNFDIFEKKEETNKTKILKLDFKNKIEDQED